MFHEKFVTDCHLSVPLQDRWGCTLQVDPSCSTAYCAAHAAKVQDWLQSSFIVQDNSAKRPGSGKVRTEHSRKWQPNIQMQNSKLLKLAHYHFLPSLFPEDLGKWFGCLYFMWCPLLVTSQDITRQARHLLMDSTSVWRFLHRCRNTAHQQSYLNEQDTKDLSKFLLRPICHSRPSSKGAGVLPLTPSTMHLLVMHKKCRAGGQKR